MGNRPIMAGSPTVEINLSRYDELLHAEVKCEQYRRACNPALVAVIEGITIDIAKESEETNE